MCSSISWCVNRGDFKRRFEVILGQDDESLDARSKDILRERYVNMVNKIEIGAKRSSFWFLTFSSLTTVGSIIVPALISIQDKTFDVDSDEEDQRQHKNNIYWASWGISLMVTMSNALVRLFSFDKTAITRKLRMNHLKSEGWLFLELSGSYSQFNTLQDAFQTFCNNIERIKTEQVEEEYTFNNSFGNPSFNDQPSNERRTSGLQNDTMV
jgi:hypothetical protein